MIEMPKKPVYYYKRHGLRIVTAYLSPEDYDRLKVIAKEADKSLTRYVTRLLEHHTDQSWSQRTEDTTKQIRKLK